MNRKQKIIFIILFLSIFLVSFLINSQNVNAKIHSDDEDVEVRLNCQLKTDSTEIYSTLMPTGTFDF